MNIDDMRPDLRLRRAYQLAASVGREILEHVRPEERHIVHDKLLSLFYQEGVEVITDAERKEIGLPPRDNKGWTAAELTVLEARRLEVMMRPIVQYVVAKNPLQSDK